MWSYLNIIMCICTSSLFYVGWLIWTLSKQKVRGVSCHSIHSTCGRCVVRNRQLLVFAIPVLARHIPVQIEHTNVLVQYGSTVDICIVIDEIWIRDFQIMCQRCLL